jgi:hypothetical protein
MRWWMSLTRSLTIPFRALSADLGTDLYFGDGFFLPLAGLKEETETFDGEDEVVFNATSSGEVSSLVALIPASGNGVTGYFFFGAAFDTRGVFISSPAVETSGDAATICSSSSLCRIPSEDASVEN